MKNYYLKCLAFFFFILHLNCFSQTDITTLSAKQWQEDLDTLVVTGNRLFAGFTEKTKKLFNEEAKKIRAAIPELKPTSIALEFTRLLALLEDGHTEVSFRTPAFHYLPLRLYYFESDLYITGVSEAHENILGGRLIAIDDVPVNKVFKKIKPYINADNEMEYLLTAPVFMTVAELLEETGISNAADEVVLTVQKEDGATIKKAVKKMTIAERRQAGFISAQKTTPLYLEDRQSWYWKKYLPDSKIMFVKLGGISNQEGRLTIQAFFDALFEEMDRLKPEKLILDFRLCRGGNYYRSRPLIEGIRARPYINQKGKIFVVHSRLTFSAGATTSLFLKDQTEALIIGETSRDRPNHSDNVEFFNLPHSKLRYGYSNRLRVHSPRLGQTDRIPVDIPLTPTFEYFKEGRDEVLEYVKNL